MPEHITIVILSGVMGFASAGFALYLMVTFDKIKINEVLSWLPPGLFSAVILSVAAHTCILAYQQSFRADLCQRMNGVTINMVCFDKQKYATSVAEAQNKVKEAEAAYHAAQADAIIITRKVP